MVYIYAVSISRHDWYAYWGQTEKEMNKQKRNEIIEYCCDMFKLGVLGYVNEDFDDKVEPYIFKSQWGNWFEINGWAIKYCPFCGIKLEVINETTKT